jgi:hypothetical protein
MNSSTLDLKYNKHGIFFHIRETSEYVNSKLGSVCQDAGDDCPSLSVRVKGSERAISFSASINVINETTSVTLLSV